MKRLAFLLASTLSAFASTASGAELPLFIDQCREAGSGPSEQPSEDLQTQNNGVDKHRKLRAELGEPMPSAPTMVLLYAAGGHLAISEYSIIVYRSAEGKWNGTAVGRSKTSIEEDRFRPMKKREWVLDDYEADRLEKILDDGCFYSESKTFNGGGGPPSRDAMFVRLYAITPTRHRSAGYLTGNAKGLTAEVDRLARPQ